MNKKCTYSPRNVEMEKTMSKLDGGIGGCLRVKSTGLPVAYDVILNMTGCIFFAAGCLA